MPYTIVKRGEEHCVVKKDDPEGKSFGCHPTPEEAQKQIGAMMSNEQHSGVFLVDEYVYTRPGEPYRLFPLGDLYDDGGKMYQSFTSDFAKTFKLPHFKPPIKIGSHAENAPAAGHIVGLEVRESGLYAIPEYNKTGIEALERGDYRYHSPEVYWETDTGMVDPLTGKPIEGPLIWGDALLHTPKLGEAAALYTIELKGGQHMGIENVEVPKTLWDKFTAWFNKRVDESEPAEPVAPEVPEEFKAALKERDELKAQMQALEAEKARIARRDSFAAQLKETKVAEGADKLAAMTDETAAWVIQNFKALSAQINESALLGELGTTGEGAGDPSKTIDEAVKALAAEKEISYPEAMIILAHDKPEMFKAAGY